MGDEGFHHWGGILWRVGHDVDHTGWYAGVLHHLAYQLMGGWADLGSLEHHCVSTSQWDGNGANGQNHGRIPWRYSEHDPRWLPDSHGQAAWRVGGDDFAGDLGGHGRRLAEHTCGELHVEAGPSRGSAGLVCA